MFNLWIEAMWNALLKISQKVETEKVSCTIVPECCSKFKFFGKLKETGSLQNISFVGSVCEGNSHEKYIKFWKQVYVVKVYNTIPTEK